jgi:transposase-like protein
MIVGHEPGGADRERDGRRQVLAVELANRESRSSWRDFLLALKRRGLNGVEFERVKDQIGKASPRERPANCAKASSSR